MAYNTSQTPTPATLGGDASEPTTNITEFLTMTTLADNLANSEHVSRAVLVIIGLLIALANGMSIITVNECQYMVMQLQLFVGSLVRANFLTGFVSMAASIILTFAPPETSPQLYFCSVVWQGLSMTLMFADLTTVTAMSVDHALCLLPKVNYQSYATNGKLTILLAILWILSTLLGMLGGVLSVSDTHSCVKAFPLTIYSVTLTVVVLSVCTSMLLVATVFILHMVRKHRQQLTVGPARQSTKSAFSIIIQVSQTVNLYTCWGLVIYLPMYFQYLYLLVRSYVTGYAPYDIAAGSSYMIPVSHLVLLRGLGNTLIHIGRLNEYRTRMMIMLCSCNEHMTTRAERLLDNFRVNGNRVFANCVNDHPPSSIYVNDHQPSSIQVNVHPPSSPSPVNDHQHASNRAIPNSARYLSVPGRKLYRTPPPLSNHNEV
jgi:hypothetical protein